MTLIILIVLGLVVAGFLATKLGMFTDKDKDGIPDKLEEKAVEVKVKLSEVKQEAQEVVAEVKERVKRVKQEAGDVAKAAKEVVKQAKDVTKAATNAPTTRKGRKPKK